MDIFEKLKNYAGCYYISDLRFEPYNTKAKELLKTMRIENCTLNELNDIAYYLYEKHFDTTDAAIFFLKQRNMMHSQRNGYDIARRSLK